MQHFKHPLQSKNLKTERPNIITSLSPLLAVFGRQQAILFAYSSHTLFLSSTFLFVFPPLFALFLIFVLVTSLRIFSSHHHQHHCISHQVLGRQHVVNGFYHYSTTTSLISHHICSHLTSSKDDNSFHKLILSLTLASSSSCRLYCYFYFPFIHTQ